MKMIPLSRQQWLILLGDVVVLVLVTLAGLGTHNNLAQAASRFPPNFVPALVAWILIAWPLSVFDEGNLRDWRQLWRPFWAMLLSAPLSTFLRALWLGSDSVIVIFVLVTAGVGSVSILFWRVLMWFFFKRREASHG